MNTPMPRDAQSGPSKTVGLDAQGQHRNQEAAEVNSRHGGCHRHGSFAIEPVVDHGYDRQPTANARAESDNDEGQVELPQALDHRQEDEPQAHNAVADEYQPAGAELVDEDAFQRAKHRALATGQRESS